MDELDVKKEALSTEKTQTVVRVRDLEAAAREKLELTKNQNEEKERATYVVNKLRDTYEKKAAEYENQAQAVAAIIVRLRQEKQEANARAQLGWTGSGSSCRRGGTELRPASMNVLRKYGRSGHSKQQSCKHYGLMQRTVRGFLLFSRRTSKGDPRVGGKTG